MVDNTVPSRDEILRRARDMVPVLRARAPEAARLRRMPDETVEDFHRAGFYRVIQPARYGGFELPFGVHTEYSAELARGCASSAWDAAITACHAWVLGMFPPEAQDDVWGDEPETTVSTSFRSLGATVERDGDGLRINGRFKFSSGVDHCRWIIVMVPAPPESGDGPPQATLVLVPLSECTVEDTWRAGGLAGTGSNDVVIDDHLAPAHRVVDMALLRGEPTPGSVVNPHYLFRLPMFGLFSFNLVGCAIGAAQGAIDQVVERLAGHGSITGVRVSAQVPVQLRISESQAEIDAARVLLLHELAEIDRLSREGEELDLERRVRYRRDNSFAAQLACRAVERIHPLIGAAGLADDDPVQRAWRDVHAVANHIGLVWDVQGRLYGAVALGEPCPDPRL